MKYFNDDFDQHKRRVLQKMDERLTVITKQYEKTLTDLGKKQFEIINLKDSHLSLKIEFDTLNNKLDSMNDNINSSQHQIGELKILKADMTEMDSKFEQLH